MTFAHAQEAKRQAHEIDSHVGAKIKAFRTQAGFSQEQLADAIGLSFQQLQKYEQAINRVSAGRLVQIATAVGRPVTAFFEPEPEPLAAHTAGNTETLQMVRAFQALPSHALRDAARRTVKAMADAAQEAAAEAERVRKAA